MKWNTLIVILAVYVLAITAILYILVFKNNKELKKRLKSIEEMGNGIQRNRIEEKETKRKGVVKINASEKLRGQLSASGLDVDPGEFILVWALFAMVPPIVIYLLTSNILFFTATLGFGAIAPPVFIRFKENKRKEKFGVQLGDALLLIGNCLRSGFSFRKALDRIVKDMSNPISEEFEKALAQIGYGASVEDALLEVGKRMENHEMELLTSAVAIHQKAGGKLSEIVENVAKTIRERIQLQQTVKTLTAQGRMSGIVVGLLPVGMLALISFLNPSYTAVFFNSFLGNMMLLIVGIMEGLGMFAISKLIKLDI